MVNLENKFAFALIHVYLKKFAGIMKFNPYTISRTYIASQASSWIDDFRDWSTSESCCKYFYSNNSFCPHTYSEELCGNCDIETVKLDWEDYFVKYLSFFLQDNPDEKCAKGGHPAYASVSFVLHY